MNLWHCELVLRDSTMTEYSNADIKMALIRISQQMRDLSLVCISTVVPHRPNNMTP